MVWPMVVAAGISAGAGLLGASKQADAAKESARRAEQLTREQMAEDKRRYDAWSSLHMPLLKMSADELKQDDGASFGLTKGLYEDALARTERGITQQMSRTGMTGSGLDASLRSTARLRGLTDTADAFLRHKQGRTAQRMGFSANYDPFRGAPRNDALVDRASRNEALALQGEQAGYAGVGNALSSLMRYYGMQNPPGKTTVDGPIDPGPIDPGPIQPTINTPNVVYVSPNGVTDSTGVYYGGGGLGALSPAGAGMFDDFSSSFFG